MSDDELLELIRTRDVAAEPELTEDKLRPMRAIWLELPDEDAPVRGLDALMAAATRQAKVMAPPAPSFWQRFLAVVKQPPVLALATIVVLVGGATLVNRHEDKLDAVPVVAVRGAPAADKASERTDVPPQRAADGNVAPATVEDRLAGSASASASGGEATATLAIEEKVTTPKLAKPKPKVSAPPPPPVVAAPESKPIGRVGGVVSGDFEAQKSEPPRDPGETKGPTSAKEPTSSADDSRAETVLRDTPTTQRPIPTTKPAADQAQPQPVTVDQLLKDCKSAASRGDCLAVRVLADRIARTNATFYRARVTKDAAIAKCLN